MKYAVYTKFKWANGVISSEEMQQDMRDHVKPGTLAEDVIWWKIDDDHHMSVIIYPSEEVAHEDRAKRLARRAESVKEVGLTLVEEHIGPVMAQMSEV